jgi:putative sigma-54 modulation protein
VQLALYGKNLDLTEALRSYVQHRLNKLDRYFHGDIPAAQVVLSVQREHQRVEVTIPFEGMILRAEESDPSMYAACDLVLDKLERQLRKHKTRIQRHRHEHLHQVGGTDRGGQDAQEEAVVREKRFPLKPMTVAEAVMQLNLLGHDFFVFREAGSEQVQVVYRRRQGGYGLIAGD